MFEKKTTDIRDLTDINHERKRDNPFNLCSDKKLCDLATLRFEKGKRIYEINAETQRRGDYFLLNTEDTE